MFLFLDVILQGHGLISLLKILPQFKCFSSPLSPVDLNKNVFIEGTGY